MPLWLQNLSVTQSERQCLLGTRYDSVHKPHEPKSRCLLDLAQRFHIDAARWILHDCIMRGPTHRNINALVFLVAAGLTAFGLADLAHNEFGLSSLIIRKDSLLGAALLGGFLLFKYTDRFGRSK